MSTVENRIRCKLLEVFEPTHLDVLNESYMHSVPSSSETHFKVTIATACFDGKRQVQRHQAIYACLEEELKSGVHALALHTFSAVEWIETGVVPNSPECLGGSKQDHR